jgi:hypothetical protein
MLFLTTIAIVISSLGFILKIYSLLGDFLAAFYNKRNLAKFKRPQILNLRPAVAEVA